VKATAAEIERLRFQAMNALLRLRNLAKTDRKALGSIADILLHCVPVLNADLMKNKDYAREVTRKYPTWPGLLSADKVIQEGQAFLAKELQLGTNATEHYSDNKRAWSRKTPENRVALKMLDYGRRNVPGLPRLTKATAGEVFKACRPFLEKICGRNFEEHPAFRSKYRNSQATASLARVTAIRQRILTKLAQSFGSIAPKN
jgi:hypothetical protein